MKTYWKKHFLFFFNFKCTNTDLENVCSLRRILLSLGTLNRSTMREAGGGALKSVTPRTGWIAQHSSHQNPKIIYYTVSETTLEEGVKIITNKLLTMMITRDETRIDRSRPYTLAVSLAAPISLQTHTDKRMIILCAYTIYYYILCIYIIICTYVQHARTRRKFCCVILL